MQDVSWWQSAVIYEIYPRSFQDTNADGIGDLLGLGVPAIRVLGGALHRVTAVLSVLPAHHRLAHLAASGHVDLRLGELLAGLLQGGLGLVTGLGLGLIEQGDRLIHGGLCALEVRTRAVLLAFPMLVIVGEDRSAEDQCGRGGDEKLGMVFHDRLLCRISASGFNEITQ